MTTLDIFANNIINNPNNSISNLNLGENPNRWILIKGAKFFIVKKMNSIDSGKINDTINLKTNTSLYFDGNIVVIDNNNNTNIVEVLNPLTKNNTDNSIFNTVNLPINKKNFTNSSDAGYSPDKTFILSTNLKWILYSDLSLTQSYLLYNPMHRSNVKKYYDEQTNRLNNADGDINMKSLINKYCNANNVRQMSNGNIAVFSDRTCNCYSDLHNCTNSLFDFYLDDLTSNTIGWNCSCTSKVCSSTSNNVTNDDSFLSSFQQKVQRINNIPCNNDITVCQLAINAAAGNVNISNNSALTQKCGGYGLTPPPTTPPPTTQPPTTQPPSTQPPSTQQPTEMQQKSSIPIIVGSTVGGGLLLILLLIYFYQKMK